MSDIVCARAPCHWRRQVFRLVTRNTYESQMVERANKKLGLERALNADRANDGLPGAAAAGSAVGAVGGAGRPGGPPADKAEIDLMLKQVRARATQLRSPCVAIGKRLFARVALGRTTPGGALRPGSERGRGFF